MNCKIVDCNNVIFARDWCRKHYARWWKWKNPHIIKSNKTQFGKCIVENCYTKQDSRHYCQKHYMRWLKYKNPLIVKKSGRSIKGKLNPNWRGGMAEYPNHAFMKKQRLIILIKNPNCERCGKPATQIHHKDLTKSNHKLSNLMASCHKCNMQLKKEVKYGNKKESNN